MKERNIRRFTSLLMSFLPQNLTDSLFQLFLLRPLRYYCRYFPLPLGKQYLWQSFAATTWHLEEVVTTTTKTGIRLVVNARDIIGRYIHYFGVWEPQLTGYLLQHVKPGDCFIDVGANIGYFSLLAATLVGTHGSVLAIEPVTSSLDFLKKSLQVNGIVNVRCVNCAAWDRQTRLEMFTRCDGDVTGVNTPIHSWASAWKLTESISVDAKPLSLISSLSEIQAARFIKIDVEGAEWHVIQGMLPMLSAARDDLEVIVELSLPVLREQGISIPMLLSCFRQYNFHSYLIPNSYAVDAYLVPNDTRAPTRIYSLPDDAIQVDLVFSRKDSIHL